MKNMYSWFIVSPIIWKHSIDYKLEIMLVNGCNIVSHAEVIRDCQHMIQTKP
jgi:hypothetical protein